MPRFSVLLLAYIVNSKVVESPPPVGTDPVISQPFYSSETAAAELSPVATTIEISSMT